MLKEEEYVIKELKDFRSNALKSNSNVPFWDGDHFNSTFLF